MPPTCGNPLLLGWLKEWWDDAKEKNSKGVLTYKKAHESMKVCPIEFAHPSEATQLYGLGPKLCDRLTAKLETHCRENGLPMPEAPNKARKRTSTDALPEAADAAPAKKARKTRPYVPALRSGPYAILVALSTIAEHSSGGLTKNETVELAQEHCDSSFTAPSDPTKFYTAWNSMKTLQNKDMVYEFGRPTKRYALTEEGWGTAKRIRSANNLGPGGATSTESTAAPQAQPVAETSVGRSRPTASIPPRSREVIDLDLDEDGCEDMSQLDKSSARGIAADPVDSRGTPNESDMYGSEGGQVLRTQGSNWPDNGHVAKESRPPVAPDNIPRPAMRQEVRRVSSSFTPVIIPAGTYSIELILDNREVRAKTDQSYIQNTLVSQEVVPTTRSLPLGDALWVARLKPEFRELLATAADDGGMPCEVMLGHIVERKRLDDLIGSIKDGRFHEQKFRLRRSGIPNVTYLIEDIALAPEVAQRTADMVSSAIAGTMVVGGFFVKRTRKLDDTIAYLARMTRLLRRRFESLDLKVVPVQALGDGRDVEGIKSLLGGEKRFFTFDTFAALAGKNDSLTLRDVFLKMLMCTKGITGDKAMEIQRRWSTPRAFIEALQREEQIGGSEGERRRREMVFKAAGQLVGRRKIGKAVSAKLCDIWGEA